MTNPRARTFLILVSAVTLTFMLAACVQVDIESDFDGDGSATHAVALSADRAFLDDQMLSREIDAAIDFDAIERQAQAAGFEFERIDTTERLGARVWTQVDDNRDLGSILTELLEASGGDIIPLSATFDGGFTESGGLGGSTYRFELNADTRLLLGQAEDGIDEEIEEDIESEFDVDLGPEMIPQFINFSYIVNMPGEITDHNGTELGSGRVQWDITFDGPQSFYAESGNGSSFSIALIIGIGIGVVTLILIVIGGVMLMRGQKAPIIETNDAAR
jgi:hypothetical protein